MALQTLKPAVPAGRKPSVLPIHADPDAGRTGLAWGRTLGGKIGFGRLVMRAAGGELDGLRRRRDLKKVDLATIGNLCVDIVLNVPSLPPAPKEERLKYMEQLAASPPDKKYWEAGGNCNLVIAAARLGLCVITLGHVGDDVYGHFLLDVLREEGINMVGMSEDCEAAKDSTMYETLLCWVLVDPFQRHGFCSYADFSDEPAFSWMHILSGRVERAIQQSKIILCNGYAFDELWPDFLVSALYCAIGAGSAMFFDPGPRGRALSQGTPEQRGALELFLKHSDVLLLTSDEVVSLTGIRNPILAGRDLIRKGVRVKWVIIKLGAKGSMLITKSSISCAPAFMVDVADTVGCGDSFTAAIAYGYMHEMHPVSILVLANAVGAATATGCGAGRNVASLTKVLELLRKSNIYEDYKFWTDLIDSEISKEDVFLLWKTCINGCTGAPVHFPLQTVVPQLIAKFESLCDACSGSPERRGEVIGAKGAECH
ncbi:putative fructokinase-4 [Apostasia shenzhenica]|uniref:Putative fructokinase-4 n=1 Tax=Apostasia shenzhenica TaxID=1088818 RepID=A0A2I0ARY4_9ASPA|nr:putative fructokinase-4 [Apostasia shenzhenica]